MMHVTRLNVAAIIAIVTIQCSNTEAHNDGDPAKHSPCDVVRCRKNFKCVMEEEKLCATPPCRVATVCKPLEPSASEPSCDNFKCSTNMKCILEKVQCIRAPCPPVPVCKADPDSTISSATCPNSLCRDGYVCKMTKLRCSSTPCEAQPQCIPLATHMSTRP